MKARPPLQTLAFALVGILIVSIGLVALGSREQRAFPSAESYLPSGASAFAELLRQSGYTVVIDHETKPKLENGDLVVAFVPTAPLGNSFITSEADEEQLAATKDAIDLFVKAGGRVLSLPISPDFADESRQLYNASRQIQSANGLTAKVSWGEDPSAGFYLDAGANTATQLWGTTEKNRRNPDVDQSRTPYMMIKTVGKGREINIADGIDATNRFIDRQANAFVLMNGVHVLARPGSRVVFAEGAFGNIKNPSLLGTIGPWALAAWFQLVFLGVIVVYTLGKPFGLPDAERRQERGARDLMDAIADTLRRGRMTKLALTTVVADANRWLRRTYRGRREITSDEMRANNMGELQEAIKKLEVASEMKAPEDVAAKLIQDVERLIKDAGTRSPGAY